MNQTPIRFTKMHALGNDFVVINTVTGANEPPVIASETHVIASGAKQSSKSLDCFASLAMTYSKRNTGIGFDQLLVIEPSTKADFYCRIYNANGEEAEQCGNGLRCVARYLHEEGLHTQNTMDIETKAGVFSVFIKDYDHIRTLMGIPVILEKALELQLSENKIPVSIVSMGNPHAIVKINEFASLSLEKMAEDIGKHAIFPKGVNVGLMQIINEEHLRLRTFERGVGETWACGSNACAAAVAGRINGWLKREVIVEYPYGRLFVSWEGENKPLHCEGPAMRVFSGQVYI